MKEWLAGERIKRQIRDWLDEDIGTGDMTTLATVPADHYSKGIIHFKEAGIAAGLPIAEYVFRTVDPSLEWKPLIRDGNSVACGDIVAEIHGNTRAVLQGERLALNLLQRLSGIATRTRAFVDAVADLPVKIADTRKTTPGLRLLEKYAVKTGGGANHRFGLYDAVMIKDNHIKAAGGVAAAIEACRNAIPHTMKIEVEIERPEQWEEALLADIIMLDNMKPDTMKPLVRRIRERSDRILIEASGGIRPENVREVAMTGVDVISIGGLTHSAPSLDISLDLYEKKGESH